MTVTVEPLSLHPERLFPSDPRTRAVAADLFAAVETLPIVSPHGHVDPTWFAADAPFKDAVEVFLKPDHYLLRMLYSQGVGLNALGFPGSGLEVEADPRAVWRRFAAHYRLFRGTPSRIWLDHAFATVFGLDVRLGPDTADHYFDVINAALAQPAFRPRALFERFGIEVIATTEGALDGLEHHQAIRASGWPGRVLTTFRPDDVVDPDREDFRSNLAALGEMTGEDVTRWEGYLGALRQRRGYFRDVGGATATDHGHPTARTADLSAADCQALLTRVSSGAPSAEDAELFRAQMLTEMAVMACDDGMTMQLHPGSFRNHNAWLMQA
jgi:glucuronate isomerase